MNLSIVTFKWKKSNQGYRLKNQVSYSAEHVNILFASIKRNTTVDFTPICVTDDATGIDNHIKIVPLWNTYQHLGGCYNRLYIFSEQAHTLFGNRFFCFDLDCVITGNIDSILNRTEDFIINEFRPNNQRYQKYNGGLCAMNSGCRKAVWNNFNEKQSIPLLDNLRTKQGYVGSDQAWIQYVLGNNESLFTNQDGVYDFNQFYHDLPQDAKIILFPGKTDPMLEKEHVAWVRQHWRK